MEIGGIYTFIQFSTTDYLMEYNVIYSKIIFINTNIYFSIMVAVEFILSLNTFQTNTHVKFNEYILFCFRETLLFESNI